MGSLQFLGLFKMTQRGAWGKGSEDGHGGSQYFVTQRDPCAPKPPTRLEYLWSADKVIL